MKTILIAIALMAITAIGVGATVSARPSTAKHLAASDAKSCATMSAAECASCPMGGHCPMGGSGGGSCSAADAASCKK
jgi:hypothetical protein